MGEQRRRGGRGRSGRGGRISKKGDQPGAFANEEAFVSFPLSVAGPIRVVGAIDEAAVEGLLRDTLDRERRQAHALHALAERTQDPVLADVRAQVDRHRGTLEQLGRELGVDVSNADESAAAESGDEWDLVARQRLCRLGWAALQRVGYAAGDKRIDRVVRPVLREKDRHTEVLELHAVNAAVQAMFRQLEE